MESRKGTSLHIVRLEAWTGWKIGSRIESELIRGLEY